METFDRSVGCDTGRPELMEDRGVLLEDVRDFYSKRHLGEPIRVTGQGIARSDKTSHCERRLSDSVL